MKSELLVLQCINGKQINMDGNGRFWRIAERSRVGNLVPCPKRRAEITTKKGYLHVRVNVDGKMRCAYAHRLVWMLVYGLIPDDQQINHVNGDKQDNRPENLELCSSKENVQHALAHGLMPKVKGEHHRLAKLNEVSVRIIRQRRENGDKLTDLATDFGVTHQAIVAVCKRRTWHHV